MKVSIEVNPTARSEVSDAGPEVSEAIKSLRFLRPEMEIWFFQRLQEVWDKGDPGLEVRKTGELFSAEHKAALGIKGFNITMEAWAALTASGKVNPVDAYESMVNRIRLNYMRRKRLEQIDRLADRRPWIVHKMIERCCSASLQYHDVVTSVADMLKFPLKNCDQAYCSCTWQQLSDRDRERLKL